MNIHRVRGVKICHLLVKPFPPLEAIQILLRIARGVAAAHSKGIVHRDLKPQNILIDRSIREPALETALGFLKISDFGIAKIMDNFEGLTRSGMQPGTITHMAPEQIDPECGAISPATDVFALGIMLYQLLTGENLFVQASVPQTLRNILEQPAPLAGSKIPAIPEWIEAICDTCLQKSPSSRFANAELLALKIEHHLGNTNVANNERNAALKSPPVLKDWSMRILFVFMIFMVLSIAIFRILQSLTSLLSVFTGSLH